MGKGKKNKKGIGYVEALPSTKDDTSQKIWFNADNKRVTTDSVVEWITNSYTKTVYGEESQLIVGTDSHLHGRQWRFVTVVCVYHPGLGGNYMINYSYEPRDMFKKGSPARMFYEVGLAIDLANWLLEKTGLVAEIHIDASAADAGEFTSPFSDQLVGYAKSSGYVGKIKPESWVASSVSDRHSK